MNASDTLPEGLCPVLTSLAAAGNVGVLEEAFTWASSPQGHEYWSVRCWGEVPLSPDDIVLLLQWATAAYETAEQPRE